MKVIRCSWKQCTYNIIVCFKYKTKIIHCLLKNIAINE